MNKLTYKTYRAMKKRYTETLLYGTLDTISPDIVYHITNGVTPFVLCHPDAVSRIRSALPGHRLVHLREQLQEQLQEQCVPAPDVDDPLLQALLTGGPPWQASREHIG